MQVFWVSGPVGKIHSFNLSFKTVIIGFSALAITLVAIGGVLQFFGFRMALEYDPQVARQLGNLHTAVELENLNAVYHARLAELEAEQQAMINKVKALEASNEKLIQTLVPPTLLKDRPKGRAQGGAYLQPISPQPPDRSVLDALHNAQKTTRIQNKMLNAELSDWEADLAWLASLPIGIPVQKDTARISSGFGERVDPINGHHAFHSGLDFQMPTHSPVLAAGAGEVIHAGWESDYGNTVIIRHRDGYTTRYAHNSEVLVKEGETVQRGQLIARSGSTGRSTGPHLHFEVHKDGQAVNPAQYLVGISRNL